MKLDKYQFFCPDCSQSLDVSNEIHLKYGRQNGDVGDVFLSTTLGNYKKRLVPDVKFEDKELVDFICPHCDSKIHSSERENFVHLNMRVEDKFDFEIIFSRIAGEQKTFLVTEDGVECYGKDCNTPVN